MGLVKLTVLCVWWVMEGDLGDCIWSLGLPLCHCFLLCFLAPMT